MVELPKGPIRTHLTKSLSRKPPHMKTGYPSEEELVRKIHNKVGGPSKLSTYDDPAHVREVVIRALADEQRTAADERRVSKGDLSAFERRVVRTVTNRGAAVRSRMRQRKELQRLRDELTRKDARLREMEARLRALTACAPCAPAFPQHPASAPAAPPAVQHEVQDFYSGSWPIAPPQSAAIQTQAYGPVPSCTASSSASLSAQDTVTDSGFTATDASLDRDLFGNLIDQLISPLS